MNGYGCKCWTQFISKQSYKEYKENGIPEAVYGKRRAKIDEVRREMITQRPEIEYVEWRNKKTGQIERVPKGITPGFDWNPGGYGRSAQLVTRLAEKAKSGTLKDSEKWLQEFFRAPPIRATYQSFVEGALTKDAGIASTAYSAIGLLEDWALEVFRKRGGGRKQNAKTGVVLIDERLLREKDTRHEKVPGGKGLSREQWLDLPNWLQNYDKVTWDSKYRALIFWKKLEEGWAAVAVGTSGKDKVGSIAGKVDYVRTAYIYTEAEWSTVIKRRKGRDEILREK